MRKSILALALLLCGGFSIAAQSRPPDATIFVTPVTGNGSKSDDNTFFYKQLLMEVIAQDFSLAKTQKSANYTLVGSLDRYAIIEGQYSFYLELRENKTGKLRADGALLYETDEDARQQFPFLVSSLLYTIPGVTYADYIEDEDTDEDWRDKLLYLGFGAKWTPGFYSGTKTQPATQSRVPAGFQGGLSLEFHFVSFMSLETGVQAQLDGVNVTVTANTTPKSYKGVIFGVPLLLKLCLKPGANSMLEPYVGAYFNVFQLGDLKPSMLSMGAGLQYSLKAGPGAVFLEAGGAMDLSKSKVPKASNAEYHRINVQVGLGYKIGLIQRETK